MKQRNFFLGIVLVMVTSFFASCSKDDDNMTNDNSPTVYMKNSVFSSASVVVVAGTTVTWQNDDTMIHTVTADDNSFDSGEIQPGGSYTRTFNSTGTFAYNCKLHPGMTGVVVVNAQ